MFNAIPEKEEEYKKIKLNIKKILNNKLKLNINSFIESYYSSKQNNQEIILDTLREIYKKNMTLKSFFKIMMKYEC